MQKTFDLDILRTLVLGVELGSFVRAADRQGRSASALSAQLRKLEEQLGQPIVGKAGRGLVLTAFGEQLFGYAKRLLDLNDEAMTALRTGALQGSVRLGLQEDFGSALLSTVLGQFARSHPNISIEVQVGRNAVLLEHIRCGRLDLALAWDIGETTPHSQQVATVPLCWIGPRNWQPPAPARPLPLVSLEAPCFLRSTAVQALEQAEIPWRQTFSSPGLGEIWAAVAAGLGVTVRTPLGLPDTLAILRGLPDLPPLGLSLHWAEPAPTQIVQTLGDILAEKIKGALQRP